mmetsp:Transcript_1389/g.2532  ORF Transcript_1389/g.2532 Transcript_1389/m.2532 type:complete len:124 (-) Transcript_1389:56-427(-)
MRRDVLVQGHSPTCLRGGGNGQGRGRDEGGAAAGTYSVVVRMHVLDYACAVTIVFCSTDVVVPTYADVYLRLQSKLYCSNPCALSLHSILIIANCRTPALVKPEHSSPRSETKPSRCWRRPSS